MVHNFLKDVVLKDKLRIYVYKIKLKINTYKICGHV